MYLLQSIVSSSADKVFISETFIKIVFVAWLFQIACLGVEVVLARKRRWRMKWWFDLVTDIITYAVLIVSYFIYQA